MLLKVYWIVTTVSLYDPAPTYTLGHFSVEVSVFQLGMGNRAFYIKSPTFLAFMDLVSLFTVVTIVFHL